jgi:hypothetical protein
MSGAADRWANVGCAADGSPLGQPILEWEGAAYYAWSTVVISLYLIRILNNLKFEIVQRMPSLAQNFRNKTWTSR